MITYKEKITVEEASNLMLAHTTAINDHELVPLRQALGRKLSTDIYAPFNNPPFNRSPYDGYACKAEDLTGATKESPARLAVICEVDAGGYSDHIVQNGEAIRIMTGAAIPEGCDCCIKQEDTDYREDIVSIYVSAKKWDNVCFEGEDFKKGTLMLQKNTRLGYIELAILSSLGMDQVEVLRRPRIALFASGDEVTQPGQPLQRGKIFDSNLTLMEARLREWGITPMIAQWVEDDPELMKNALLQASEKADLIITTGGVSVGKKDIMHPALDALGAERVFWQVKMKPGMPTLFTVYNQVPIISLSGNPFGVAVTLERLVRPTLEKMTGDTSIGLVYKTGIMNDDFPKAIRGRRYIRAIYKDGQITLPNGLHSNGVLASMQGCNCLIETEPGINNLTAGCQVQVIMLA